jgi:hypothetical protein
MKALRDVRGVLPRQNQKVKPQSVLELADDSGNLVADVPARQLSEEERLAIKVRLGLLSDQGKEAKRRIEADLELCRTLKITPKQLEERRSAGIADNEDQP